MHVANILLVLRTPINKLVLHTRPNQHGNVFFFFIFVRKKKLRLLLVLVLRNTQCKEGNTPEHGLERQRRAPHLRGKTRRDETISNSHSNRVRATLTRVVAASSIGRDPSMIHRRPLRVIYPAGPGRAIDRPPMARARSPPSGAGIDQMVQVLPAGPRAVDLA